MKKWFKSLFLTGMILGILVGNVLEVKAAPNSIITSGSPTLLNGYVNGTKFYKIPLNDGTISYCLNIHKKVPRSTTLYLAKEMDAGIAYLLENGYPNKRFTQDENMDYYITQTAIWWYLDQTTNTSNLTEAFKVTGTDQYGLRNHIKTLVNGAITAKNKGYQEPTIMLSAQDTTLELTKDKKYYETKEIMISGTNISGEVSLSSISSAKEVEIVKKSGALTKMGKVGETFKIRIPVSTAKVSEKIKVTATANGTIAKAYEYRPNDNTLQNITPSILYKENKKVETSLDFSLSTSIVKIIKVDAKTNTPLKGALLVLKNQEGKIITSWQSTEKAHQIKNLPNGTYILTEKQAPKGYKLDNQEHSFTITDQNKDITIKISNTPKTNIVNILKIDAKTKQPLAGAILIVKNKEGNVVARFTTTEDAYILQDLEDGEYIVEEEQAPFGYEKSDEKISFTIDDTHTSHQITLENYETTLVPFTASSSILYILGSIILLSGIGFVYYYGKKKV